MKKLLTPALAILMVSSLTACSGNQANRNEKSSAGSSSVERASSTAEGSNVRIHRVKLRMTPQKFFQKVLIWLHARLRMGQLLR